MITVKNQNVFACADLHFCHNKILESCKRPFSSIQEHDEVIIQNINKIVKKNDYLFILGDFCLANKQKTLEIRNRLNGRIFLIRGNHDRSAYQIRDTFEFFGDKKEIEINNRLFFMSHYPHLSWNKLHYGCCMLFGHSHCGMNSFIDKYLPNSKMLDVGIDGHNYTPWSLEEINEYMDKKSGQFLDHNKPDETIN